MDNQKKEDEYTEFKQSLAKLKDGLCSISAILNKHRTGELWFGIRNNGKPVGMTVTEKTLRDVSQTIAANIEPKIYPQVSKVNLEGKDCVKISFAGNEIPYFAYGRAYMRVADEDRQLSAKELENLILAKNRDKLRWDNEPANVKIKDMDEAKLKNFVERAGLKWTSKKAILAKLDLLQDARILKTASLFFLDGAGMQLRCAVFGGTTSSNIIDRHDFSGDILELIDEAQKYVLKNIHIGMRVEGLYREDIPEISEEALREAIINAFCHRDYRDPDHVQIAIFKDRVEIRNPGSLFGGLTIADICQGHVSRRRNPLICEMFRRIHMVEAWGRGIPLILEKEPDVKFNETAGLFITSFERPSFKADMSVPPVSRPSQPTQSIDPKKAHVEAYDEAHEPMTVVELKILDACSGEPQNTHFLLNVLGYKTRTGNFKRAISRLLKFACLEMTIPDKPKSRMQKYRITEKGRKILEDSK